MRYGKYKSRKNRKRAQAYRHKQLPAQTAAAAANDRNLTSIVAGYIAKRLASKRGL